MLESQSKVSFSLSVKELLEMASQDRDQKLIQAALEVTGLSGYEYKDVLKLSNGERQRAFVAHALVTPSKIIFLMNP